MPNRSSKLSTKTTVPNAFKLNNQKMKALRNGQSQDYPALSFKTFFDRICNFEIENGMVIRLCILEHLLTDLSKYFENYIQTCITAYMCMYLVYAATQYIYHGEADEELFGGRAENTWQAKKMEVC